MKTNHCNRFFEYKTGLWYRAHCTLDNLWDFCFRFDYHTLTILETWLLLFGQCHTFFFLQIICTTNTVNGEWRANKNKMCNKKLSNKTAHMIFTLQPCIGISLYQFNFILESNQIYWHFFSLPIWQLKFIKMQRSQRKYS